MPIFTALGLGAAAAGAATGAASSIASGAIGAGSASAARKQAAQAGEYGQYSKFRDELGATNAAFKGAIDDTRNSAFDPYAAQQNQVRQGQLGLAGLLGQRAMGQGPSLVDPMMAEARDNAIAQQMALANSSRAGNAGIAQRQAGLNTAQASQGIARSGMQSKLQEIMGAREQLAGLLNQVRGGDVTAGTVASNDSIARQQQRASLFQQALGREQAAASAATGTLTAQNAANARGDTAIGGAITGVGNSLTELVNPKKPDTFGADLAEQVKQFPAIPTPTYTGSYK